MARESLADLDITEEDLSGPRVDRRTTMRLLAMTGLAGLAGCLGDDTDDDDDDVADDDDTADDSDVADTDDTADDVEPTDIQFGGTFNCVWPVDGLTTLDPPSQTGQDMAIGPNIFSGLVKFGEDLSILGDLAQDWEVDDGGRRFTFQLRDGIEFHNGDPFTPEDLQFTLHRSVEELGSWRLEPLLPPYDGGVEIISDTEVALNFDIPYASALIYLNPAPSRDGAVVSESIIEDMGEDQFGLTPVGTGPFEVVEHTSGEELILEAYDNYFMEDEHGNQLPYLDRVEVSFVSEPGTIVSGLQTGDFEFCSLITHATAGDIEAAEDVYLREHTGATFVALKFNTDREPFDDPDVRRAVAKLIDRQEFVDRAYFGYAIPGRGPLNPFNEWVWRDDKPNYQGYDPEGAQEILEEKGLEDLSFEILSSPLYSRQNEVLELMLSEMGIDVELNSTTTGTFWGRIFQQDYTAATSVNVTAFDPQNDTWNYFRPPGQGGNFNVVGYNEEGTMHYDRVQELLVEQRIATDQDERAELFWEMEDLLMEDAPLAWLGHYNNLEAYRDHVRGLDPVTYIQDFSEVWLDE